ncbi:MAG: hypothetical protein K9L17_00955 [Clostridiales bacterium]|nr:hypothetical protein [Clostridiales bacterium]MCF8021261.1 hypothetical protein [Clostridiales bacterium]
MKLRAAIVIAIILLLGLIYGCSSNKQADALLNKEQFPADWVLQKSRCLVSENLSGFPV